MTRLMCSKDRNEVEDLKSKLFRAGIRSEIRSNPVASAFGVTRLEIHIYDADFIEASKIHQDFLTKRDTGLVSNGVKKSEAGKGEVVVVVEPVQSPIANAQLTAPAGPAKSQAAGGDSSSGDLAEAAVLLEKEVEDVLARDRKLTERCAAMEEQVKAFNESLAQVQSELARQSSGRSAAEQKLVEASAAQASLQKEFDGANKRLKTAEHSLAAANGRLESQTRDLKLQQAKVIELGKEVASRDNQLGKLAESLAQTRAALQDEKGLREIAEQKANEHAAARKSLEQQINHLEELRTQNQHDREQVQAYLDTVNKLRSRLSQKRIPPQEH